jgi:TetR/AcrR family transcriptional repressor of mexJK operon
LSIGHSASPEKKPFTGESGRRKAGRPLDRAKRAAIVDTAAHHFFHHGYAATAIEQVAADAGVSKVTIYNQFGDKRALFTAAVECECEKMRGHFSMDAMPSGALRERLIAIGQAIFAFLFRPEMIQFERWIAAETDADPAIGIAFLEAGPWRMKQAFGALLADMAEQGELAIEDPALAAEQFVSMCKGMGDLERRFGASVTAAERDRRIASAVEVFLAAYGTAENR